MDQLKQYDPSWPFPQFDEQGKQLLPQPDKRSREERLIDEVGEATW